MRDAFGGAFMIKLFLIFIFIYISFTAVALSYAKAFKVKNKIIDYLEESEITSLGEITAKQMEDFGKYIDEEIVGNMNYNMSAHNICKDYPKTDNAGRTTGICHEAGVTIDESGIATNTEGVYYTVSTYLGWSLEFLNELTSLNGNNTKPEVVTGMWKISGETRVFVRK